MDGNLTHSWLSFLLGIAFWLVLSTLWDRVKRQVKIRQTRVDAAIMTVLRFAPTDLTHIVVATNNLLDDGSKASALLPAQTVLRVKILVKQGLITVDEKQHPALYSITPGVGSFIFGALDRSEP